MTGFSEASQVTRAPVVPAPSVHYQVDGGTNQMTTAEVFPPLERRAPPSNNHEEISMGLESQELLRPTMDAPPQPGEPLSVGLRPSLGVPEAQTTSQAMRAAGLGGSGGPGSARGLPTTPKSQQKAPISSPSEAFVPIPEMEAPAAAAPTPPASTNALNEKQGAPRTTTVGTPRR